MIPDRLFLKNDLRSPQLAAFAFLVFFSSWTVALMVGESREQ